MDTTAAKKILIIAYSLSGQTSNLLARLTAGLEKSDVSVTVERLRPLQPIRFPFGSIRDTLLRMAITFCRRRVAIAPLSDKCRGSFDLIILAGPTWSYHPSGPVLFLLDRDGDVLFAGQKVIPFISCRGYWRAHWLGLRHLLGKKGAKVVNRIIFTHPGREPWRTLGVFLKLTGRFPAQSGLVSRHYPRYGHTRKQLEEAALFGNMLGVALSSGHDLSGLDFATRIALHPDIDG
ncbi:MAG: flavodoxin family protein [Thermodesulfobacteriota bacterium]